MGIWKIDGVRADPKGRKNEEDFNINLQVSKRSWKGVRIDVEITPLFCMRCKKQLEGFYKHDGSRYGHVGEVGCNHCGAAINCVDHDNIVTELITYSGDGEKYIIDYYQLYHLEQETWHGIKKRTGYDISTRHHEDEWIPLQTVMEEIFLLHHIRAEDLPPVFIETSEMIKKLPDVVNRWISLLHYLKLK